MTTILSFIQRYALFIAIVSGVICRLLVLPDDTQWWLGLGIMVAIQLAIYLLLYKDGVTLHKIRR